MKFIFSNCTSPEGENLAYLLVNKNYGYCWKSGSIYLVTANFNMTGGLGTSTYSAFFSGSYTGFSNSYGKYTDLSLNDAIIEETGENTGAYYLKSNNIMACGIQIGYANNDMNTNPTSTSGKKAVMFTNKVGNFTFPAPDLPSGDTSGETGGESTTGQITNPSGEVTGQIDLTNIENSLTNIENKIPSSGDISIAVGQATANYWGNSGDLSGEKQQQEIEGNLNNLMQTISGELTQNEVIQQLERSRSRVFKLF